VFPTEFTDLVGCRYPLQQAGMGAVAGPDLVLAVSAAGALGMLGAPGWPAPDLAEVLDAMAAVTDAPFGVTFLIPFLDPAAVEAAASRCRVVEFFYGGPDAAHVATVHDGGALAAWQVGSAEEARAAAAAGCDFVVAQGVEAGGHVRGTEPLSRLLPEVLAAVDTPVVAGGGIATGAGMAEALRRGAHAVRVGTRFVATVEADAHPDYQQALVDAGPDDTVVTNVFKAGWDAPHRVLRSAVEASDDPERSVMPPSRATPGPVAAMALYAGTSVGETTAVVPAAQVVEELVHEAHARLET
jgi:NAD(P)H-dependent flavin oxidoreductase YrpB (nitropropane dioxygenase family)